MNVHDIDAVCITLDRNNPNRAQESIKSIKKLGFRNADFIDGVRGKNLSDNDIKSVCSIRTYYELKHGRYLHEAHENDGTIGCYLAHLNAWKLCLEKQEPLAIFEDDFKIIDDANITEEFEDAIKYNYDIFRIVYKDYPEYGKEIEPLTDKIVRVKKALSGMAYVITPRCAEILVYYALPMEIQLDSYIDFIVFYANLNCYGPVKKIEKYSLLGNGSTIGHTLPKTYDSVVSPKFGKYLVLILLFATFVIISILLYHNRNCKCSKI
ncbi:MAG: glycosyltransferase family 25 protein [Romboutsia sp.]|nr:glycosyltransferase family 25 protein [Romboutsia sp.]